MEKTKDISGQSTGLLEQPAWPSAALTDSEREERRRYDRIWAAYAYGDFATCRREAAALAARAEQPEVRLRAQALVERLRPDPLAIVVACGAILVLVAALASTYL